MAAKETGTCKWFNTKKGFGFIIPDNGNPDIFVHQSFIKSSGFRSLGEGEKVEYNVEIDPNTNKEKAVNVSGPNGADVIGTQRPQFNNNNGGYGQQQGGYGQQQGGYGQQQGGYGQQQGGFQQGYQNNNYGNGQQQQYGNNQQQWGQQQQY